MTWQTLTLVHHKYTVGFIDMCSVLHPHRSYPSSEHRGQGKTIIQEFRLDKFPTPDQTPCSKAHLFISTYQGQPPSWPCLNRILYVIPWDMLLAIILSSNSHCTACLRIFRQQALSQDFSAGRYFTFAKSVKVEAPRAWTECSSIFGKLFYCLEDCTLTEKFDTFLW